MAQPFSCRSSTLPYPARLNPHLGRARGRTPSSGRATMGMIEAATAGSGTRPTSTRTTTRCCARTPTPTATAQTLDSITDWYVWVFFFDDHFLELFKRTRDLAARKAYLDRLPRSCRSTGATSPEPANPVEAGLADLWARTVPGDVARTGAPVRREHPEPARRVAVGAGQHQRRAGSPTPSSTSRCAARSAARRGRPTSSSTRSAPRSPTHRRQPADARAAGHVLRRRAPAQRPVLLPARGRRTRASSATACWSSRHFLGCATQQAAEAVNDLLTSRLHQFENTALTELPLLFAEHALDPRRARGGARATSRACRTGSPAATSGTCAPAAT